MAAPRKGGRKSIADMVPDLATEPAAIPPRSDEPTTSSNQEAETPRVHEAETSIRTDAVESVGHEAVTSRSPEPTTSGDREDVKPLRRNAATNRRQAAARPVRRAPSAGDAVALTVRFDPDEYTDIDEWLISLRRELGRRKLDKSEVVRALIQAARENAHVRKALLSILSTS